MKKEDKGREGKGNIEGDKGRKGEGIMDEN